MKNIKTFEEFEVNEISQFAANKAARAAGDKVANTGNNLTKQIKREQRDKFDRYINPALKQKAEAMGFQELGRYMNHFYANLVISDREVYEINMDMDDINKIIINYQGVRLDPSKVPSIVLRKINNFYNMISKDESNPNAIELF